MIRRDRRRRAGFTLLEVLLASAIAVLLLGGLYKMLDLTLRTTAGGREAVEVDNLARGVFNKMTADLSVSLGPLPPKSGGNNAQGDATAAAGSSATGTGSTGATGSAGTTGTDTSTGSGTGTTSSTGTAGAGADASADSTMTQALAAAVPLQAGVIGADRQLTVFMSRVPKVMADVTATADQSVQVASDLRRVTYWVAGGGGLCRQERPWVTADGVRDSADPDLTDEGGDIIAEQVTDALFEYFDGSGWQPSWDGSVMGPDGVTPLGPPRAVRVTLSLELAGPPGVEAPRRQVVHVIPVRAAPGLTTPAMTDTGDDPEAVDGGTTTTGGTTP